MATDPVISNIIFSAMAVAGIGMLWRVLLEDSPCLQNFLRNNLHGLVRESLECPFCFTYWASLLWSIFFDPLDGWLPPMRFLFFPWASDGVRIFTSWMALGVAALVVRMVAEQVPRLIGEMVWRFKQSREH